MKDIFIIHCLLSHFIYLIFFPFLASGDCVSLSPFFLFLVLVTSGCGLSLLVSSSSPTLDPLGRPFTI